MVQVASIFSQLLQEIPRCDFQGLVKQYGAERAAKGFTSWKHLVSMLFCHLARAESLRDIEHGLAATEGKLIHLGMDEAPAHSTLSYANGHRPPELFRQLFYLLLERFQGLGMNTRKKKFRFKNKLLSLDATVIPLCLSLFPWAKFRRKKGGVKVHVLLDHDVYMPRFVNVKVAKEHESAVAWEIQVPAESIVAMDMGYTDYDLYASWTGRHIWFVTRQKDNAAYEVVERRPVPQNRNILSDEVIRLTGPKAPKDLLLRRVVIWVEEKGEELVLLTNHLGFGATTIAAIYKERWEIELFFKTLKQHLTIRTFVGTSENAVLTQIWTALIALLIIKWLHFRSQMGLAFATLAGVLRLILFTYRDLETWLREPFRTPPLVPNLEQPLPFR